MLRHQMGEGGGEGGGSDEFMWTKPPAGVSMFQDGNDGKMMLTSQEDGVRHEN